MQKYLQAFIDKLEAEGIKYSMADDNTVNLTYRCDNIQSLDIYAFFDEDGDPYVQFRSWNIENFKNNQAGGYEVCNALNLQYRWVKFFLDKDYDVVATLDAVLDIDSADDECLSLMNRFINIVDGAYPSLAKARWA